MPQTIQLFRILLAAPVDITDEQESVAELIGEWNVQHGETAEARIELMNWRTHAHPEVGKRAQALINRQFADRSDIVLAIFWRRLGSPTGKASSGTVEEIERAQRRRKKVMVYFSQRPGIDEGPLDPREQSRIEQYKRKLRRNALCGNYRSVKEFETAVRKDLALVMHEVLETSRNKR